MKPVPPNAADDGPARRGAERELSAPALAAGLAVGVLLALGNVYMGLKTGLWDSGSITASVLGFGLLSGWAALSGRRASPLETNVAQSAAAAAGAAPAAAGLLGAVPALAMLGQAPPTWAVAGWGIALGTLGVLLALALRRRLLEEERLPFPTGVAAARVIRAAHGGEGAGAGPVLGAAVLAASAALGRDLLGLFPAVQAWPAWLAALGGLNGPAAAAAGLGLAWSPMMWAAGLLVGARSGLGMAAGGLLAYAVVGPRLVAAGVAQPSFESLVAWLAWPGVGVLLGSTAVSLALQRRSFGDAARDLRRLRAGGRRAWGLALLAAAAALALGVGPLGLSAGQALLALALAAPLGAVCARAAGLTDFSPAGDVGQLALATTAVATRAAPSAAVAAGQVTAGVAAQAAVSLWSLRAGQELSASPRRQGLAMLVGAALGALIAVPAYLLLARAHGLGSAALPAPGALPWKALAAATGAGLGAVPRGALPAAGAALVAGALLELAGRARAGRWLPAAGAVGMGFLVPVAFSAAMGLGALLGAAWAAASPARAGRLGPLVAAGAIAGESLAGLAAAAVQALG